MCAYTKVVSCAKAKCTKHISNGFVEVLRETPGVDHLLLHILVYVTRAVQRVLRYQKKNKQHIKKQKHFLLLPVLCDPHGLKHSHGVD